MTEGGRDQNFVLLLTGGVHLIEVSVKTELAANPRQNFVRANLKILRQLNN